MKNCEEIEPETDNAMSSKARSARRSPIRVFLLAINEAIGL